MRRSVEALRVVAEPARPCTDCPYDEPGKLAAMTVEKPRSHRVHPLAYMLVITLMAVALGVFLTVSVVTDSVGRVTKTLNDGTPNGFKNRATTCQLIVYLGKEPPPPCLDPQVLRYYSRTTTPAGP